VIVNKLFAIIAPKLKVNKHGGFKLIRLGANPTNSFALSGIGFELCFGSIPIQLENPVT
jgi:hypothetical protein